MFIVIYYQIHDQALFKKANSMAPPKALEGLGAPARTSTTLPAPRLAKREHCVTLPLLYGRCMADPRTMVSATTSGS